MTIESISHNSVLDNAQRMHVVLTILCEDILCSMDFSLVARYRYVVHLNLSMILNPQIGLPVPVQIILIFTYTGILYMFHIHKKIWFVLPYVCWSTNHGGNVYLQLHNQMSSFQRHCGYKVYNKLQADERATRIDKKVMEIDQNDQNPPNSIIKLSKAFDNTIQACKIWSKQTISITSYLHSIQHTASRWDNHRNWQETHGDRPIKSKETKRETAPRSGDTKKILYPINTHNSILRLTRTD